MSTTPVEEYIAANYEVIYIDTSIDKFEELDTFFIGYHNTDSDSEINGTFINQFLGSKIPLLVSSEVMMQALKERNVTPLKFVFEDHRIGQWGSRLYKNFEKIDKGLRDVEMKWDTEAHALGHDMLSKASSKNGVGESRDLTIKTNKISIALLEKERDLLKQKYKKANDIFSAQMDSIIHELDTRKERSVAILAPKRFIKLKEKHEVSLDKLHDYLKTNRKTVILLPKIPE